MTAAVSELPPFPAIPCPGGWELGAPEKDGPPVRYLGMADFHALVGGNKRALYELRKRDGGIWTPDPAVLVGDVAGWYRQDIITWGIDTGRLHENGEINTSRAGRPLLTEPLKHWRRRTRVYLSVKELGEAFGMQSGMGVTLLRNRQRLVDADVIIGEIRGISAELGERFARQTGRAWNLPAAIAAALDEVA